MRLPASLSTRRNDVLQPVNFNNEDINNNENAIAANNVENNEDSEEVDEDDDNIDPLEAERRYAQIIYNYNWYMDQQKNNNCHKSEDSVICID